ncbi:MAG: ATP-binding cassette domain-containing protein [Tepidisphaera sp.]|nr:ATP-binding cassette domain-containing protein [Tepidisphaera sp.]
MVRLQGVSFAYPHAAFSLRVDELALQPGEHAACIGPSGAGKTTLVSLIAGLLLPQQGEVRALGRAMSELSPSARRELRLTQIGMVFQEFELLDYMTALENMTLAWNLGAAGDIEPLREAARETARAAGIEHLLSRKPRQLSQGERQRVALCRALATRPRLILCDEPTGNLDPKATGAVLDLLLDQAAATNAAVLMVTHNHAILPRFGRVIDLAAMTPGARDKAGAFA